MTLPVPTLEQLAGTVAAMQADILRLQADVDALKAAEQTRQQIRDWQRTLPRSSDTDPKPRETGGQRG